MYGVFLMALNMYPVTKKRMEMTVMAPHSSFLATRAETDLELRLMASTMQKVATAVIAMLP